MTEKTTSVQELKSLIEAIDLMSDDDEWTPNARQWARIKGKIETLEEGPAAVAPAQQNAYQTRTIRTPAATNRPNPAEMGMINFPEVPATNPATIPDGASPPSSLNAGGHQPSTPVQSTDGQIPEKPPGSPGL